MKHPVRQKLMKISGDTFIFKQFTIRQERCAGKVGVDGVLLGTWADGRSAQTALDIGTGTGLLALMLAQRFPTLRITAVEHDPHAAQQAAENVAASPWPDRVQVVHQDSRAFAQTAGRFDLIVSNPPYFDTATSLPSPQTARQQARHTTTLTHAQLVADAARLLAENGRFCLIIPAAVSTGLMQLALAHKLHCTHRLLVRPVPHKPPHRHLLQFERHSYSLREEEIVIEENGRHHYSAAFQQLTRDGCTNKLS